MNYKLKEVLLGIAYGLITMLFMLGLLPWAMVSSVVGCVVAMLAVWRIRKKMKKEENATFFTVSYMAFIAISMLFLNSLSISA